MGTSWLPRVGWDRRLKMKHEKGFGCFMVPMSGVGRVGWDRFRKAQNEA